MTRLGGKSALVTGGASGIGRATAGRFAAEGATVVIADIDGASAARVACELGPQVLSYGLDISSEPAVEGMFTSLSERGISLDVVVANAGVQLIGQDAPAGVLDLGTWEQTIRVNLTGTFLTLKHAVRAMEGRGGSVIVTGSPTGITGEGKSFTAYAASKGGIHSLVRAAAADYAAHGIRVNTVIPGYTTTPLVRRIESRTADHEALISRIPLGRQGTPADLEGIMVFLASDESAYATGCEFIIDGGLTTL